MDLCPILYIFCAYLISNIFSYLPLSLYFFVFVCLSLSLNGKRQWVRSPPGIHRRGLKRKKEEKGMSVGDRGRGKRRAGESR